MPKSKKKASHRANPFTKLKPKLIKLPLKELGGQVYIKELSGVDIMEGSGSDTGSVNDTTLAMVAKCIVDRKGKRFFDDDHINDLEALPARIFKVLLHEATAINGISVEDSKN